LFASDSVQSESGVDEVQDASNHWYPDSIWDVVGSAVVPRFGEFIEVDG
jgi:hypothetical protein